MINTKMQPESAAIFVKSDIKSKLKGSWVLVVIVILFLVQLSQASLLLDDEDEESPGILGKVRNFLGELGTIANEVTSGINKLSRQIRTVEEFLDATVDEDCYFECPTGKVTKPRRGHVPTSNGCGSYGFEEYLKEDMLPLSEFVGCCNLHDLCYERCGADRDECDLKFKKCLYGKCREVKDSVSKLKFKGCQAGAKLLYTGTTAVGCKPYLEAQEAACDCISVHDEV